MSKPLETCNCTCGGESEWVDSKSGFIDQLKCTKCSYETPPYWDGAPYAVAEWNKRNKKECQT